MNAGLLQRLALLNCFAVLALAAAALLLYGLSIAHGEVVAVGADVIGIASMVLLSVLAYRIVSRRPENRLGIGLSVIALLISTAGLADAYIHHGLVTSPGSLPAVELAVWLDSWLWVVAVMPLLTYLFLTCPDGKLPSRRWRPVAIFIAANLALLAVTTMVVPFDSYPEIENPLRARALSPWVEIANYAGYVGLIPSIGLSAAAMVLRFRRSTGVERLQLKWFVSASVAAFGLFILSWIVALFTTSEAVWGYWLVLSVGAVLTATAVAVLRHRLYDIDRIINRTLVYGLLTAGLALTYVGLVAGLQALLRPVSGGSDLAIVLTTLVVAALFLPARRRVQDAVDRRFNRRAYDAARTIDAFSSRLREQIDLDTLRYELLSVVDETMQPAKASLWLRSQEVRQ